MAVNHRVVGSNPTAGAKIVNRMVTDSNPVAGANIKGGKMKDLWIVFYSGLATVALITGAVSFVTFAFPLNFLVGIVILGVGIAICADMWKRTSHKK